MYFRSSYVELLLDIHRYANGQLDAEVWKIAFKILIPVQIRVTPLCSGMMCSYHCFIPLPVVS